MKLPYLHIWIDIWLIQVRTCLMWKSYENLTKEYVTLEIKILNKWGFEFSLYAPNRR